jgi:hypothetical protein
MVCFKRVAGRALKIRYCFVEISLRLKFAAACSQQLSLSL